MIEIYYLDVGKPACTFFRVRYAENASAELVRNLNREVIYHLWLAARRTP